MENLVPKRIREIRRILKTSQEEFSLDLDIKKSTLGSYEEGRAKVPIEIIVKVMELYGLPMEDMFDFIFDPKYKL